MKIRVFLSSTISSVTHAVTMCKVMTEVMTLTTNARHGHDSSHEPAKIQHAQKPEDVDKVHARLT